MVPVNYCSSTAGAPVASYKLWSSDYSAAAALSRLVGSVPLQIPGVDTFGLRRQVLIGFHWALCAPCTLSLSLSRLSGAHGVLSTVVAPLAVVSRGIKRKVWKMVHLELVLMYFSSLFKNKFKTPETAEDSQLLCFGLCPSIINKGWDHG